MEGQKEGRTEEKQINDERQKKELTFFINK